MKIPQQDELIEIEYKGERLSAIVNSLSPHRDEPGIFWLWLQVDAPIQEGEYVHLITEEGRFPQLGVNKVQARESSSLIQVRAYEGFLPERERGL